MKTFKAFGKLYTSEVKGLQSGEILSLTELPEVEHTSSEICVAVINSSYEIGVIPFVDECNNDTGIKLIRHKERPARSVDLGTKYFLPFRKGFRIHVANKDNLSLLQVAAENGTLYATKEGALTHEQSA